MDENRPGYQNQFNAARENCKGRGGEEGGGGGGCKQREGGLSCATPFANMVQLVQGACLWQAGFSSSYQD